MKYLQNRMSQFGRCLFVGMLLLVASYDALNAGVLTVNVQAEKLKEQSGALWISANQDSLVLLVVDTAGGFASSLSPHSINIGDFIDGGNDRIVERWRLGDLTGLDGAFIGFTSVNVSASPGVGQVGVGDSIGLYWFPSLTLADTAISANDRYGAFLTGNVNPGAADAWITLDSGVIDLEFFTSDANQLAVGGPNPAAAGRADQTVVPEPSSYVLFALSGMVLLGITRRRRRGLA